MRRDPTCVEKEHPNQNTEKSTAAVPGTKGHRKVDLVEWNASEPVKVPLKAAETTHKSRAPNPRGGANSRFASAVRCFLKKIESS